MLVIAGDICGGVGGEYGQAQFLDNEFREWLEYAPATAIVATWGNHDWIGQARGRTVPHLPWHLLVDSGVEIAGVKFWGTPWQPWFHDWAFNATEEELDQHFAKIPEGTDVLVSHGPPYGYGDLNNSGHRCGSKALYKHILRVKPQLVVCGHIHEAYGEYAFNGTSVVNAAQVNHRYERTRGAIEWQLEK